MRQPGKNNRQRGRGRRNGSGQINRNTTLDSNGPDVRLRGNALQLHEKYVSLGNDASAAGERISAEAYYQHADHYFRVHSTIVAASEERRSQHQDQAGDPPQAEAKGGKASGNGKGEPAEDAMDTSSHAADAPAENAKDDAVAEEMADSQVETVAAVEDEPAA